MLVGTRSLTSSLAMLLLAITAVVAPNAAANDLSPEERALYEPLRNDISLDSFATLPWHMKKMLSIIAVKQAQGQWNGKLRPAYCFDGNVPIDVIDYLNKAYYNGLGDKFNEIGNDRWFTTATGGSGTNQGDPVVLTYSFVPDGTLIPGDATIIDTETANPMADANSNLFAFFDGIYGNTATWQNLFHAVFQNWSEKTGITYVFEPNDDGAPFPDSGESNGTPGQLGVRGDIRIAGIRIDGESGGNILAFNFYPDTGDMVIDTANPTFFGNLSGSSRRLRNVVAHEHGHGLGMPHTCPVNGTKLMEPTISTAFDGVQPDERLSGQRTYGDPNERSGGNDTSGTATDLGTIDESNVQDLELSIDDNTDIDFFKFTIAQPANVTIDVIPIGTTYLSGTQMENGNCTSGTNFDALRVANLNVDLIASNGSAILATGNSQPAGNVETIDFNLATPGVYFVRVYQAASVNNVQGYNLSVTASIPPPPIPDADFSASVTSGTAPLVVDFTDLSTNVPTEWEWDFENDGTPDSTEQNPTHVFATPGVYTVKLTATNEHGSADEVKTNFITVTQLETDLVVSGGTWVEVGGKVAFTALPAGASYQWYKDDVLLDAEANQTLAIDPIDFDDAGAYHCEVTTAAKGIANTPTAVLVVFAAGALPAGSAFAAGALSAILLFLAVSRLRQRKHPQT